jgi:hypothetical protein
MSSNESFKMYIENLISTNSTNDNTQTILWICSKSKDSTKHIHVFNGNKNIAKENFFTLNFS